MALHAYPDHAHDALCISVDGVSWGMHLHPKRPDDELISTLRGRIGVDDLRRLIPDWYAIQWQERSANQTYELVGHNDHYRIRLILSSEPEASRRLPADTVNRTMREFASMLEAGQPA